MIWCKYGLWVNERDNFCLDCIFILRNLLKLLSFSSIFIVIVFFFKNQTTKNLIKIYDVFFY